MRQSLAAITAVLTVAIHAFNPLLLARSNLQASLSNQNGKLQCRLPKVHVPSPHDGHRASITFWSNSTVNRQVERLSAAVAVPSVCYDDLGDFDLDKRWNSFSELHTTLRELFPLV
jgi:hypothetical protein